MMMNTKCVFLVKKNKSDKFLVLVFNSSQKH